MLIGKLEGDVSRREPSVRTAAVYEPAYGGRGAIRPELTRLGWRVVAARDTAAMAGIPAQLWAVDLAAADAGCGAALDTLSRSRPPVPLLLVATEDHLLECREELTALRGRWRAPVELLEKPYSRRNLHLHVEWLAGEHGPATGEDEVCEIGALRVDAGRHRVWYDGRLTPIRGRELWVLLALMRADGRVLDKRALARAFPGGDEEYNGEAIKTYVRRLRKQLEEAGADPRVIGTIHGAGYFFDAAYCEPQDTGVGFLSPPSHESSTRE